MNLLRIWSPRLRSPGCVALLLVGLATAAPLALVSFPAHAHQIWLEQDGKKAKLYFGEFAENLREASPGLLDKFVAPTATVVSGKGDKPAELSKEANAFVLSAHAAKGESLIVVDSNYPLFEKRGGDKAGAPKKDGGKKPMTLWTPAARYIDDFSAQAPKLALDIVPTGSPGQFQVVFRGQPLPKAKIEVAAASGWGRELRTDDKGQVTLALPWKSAYLLAVHHEDLTPGTRKSAKGDEAYDVASFVTTLFFRARNGLAAPPPPPLAPPNK